ncbi:MAG TPA: hypothetical protein QGG59_06765 [Planctomycetota bacterium]|nr:hypothetical protein [Planctomycetota bacterium]MDP7246904.1 hypothetical protein [Planctomycetota bacterium]MDP7559971.1 hypothetical protein [Planctomycetota bacterium]HJM39802.1 hypothetical protein [Planctomycetota bacterium]
MTGRCIGLLLIACIELLGTLSLRNEADRLQARVEVHRRIQETCRLRLLELRTLREAYVSPTAIRQRQAARRMLGESIQTVS